MAIVFNATTKHGTMTFEPGPVVAFQDVLAEDYFVKAGLAKTSTKRASSTYPEGTVVIDPNTVFGSGELKGQKVFG